MTADELSIPPAQRVSSFRDMCYNEYPKISQFIGIKLLTKQRSLQHFQNRRQFQHSKNKDDLEQFRTVINENIKRLKNRLNRISSRPVPSLGPIYSTDHDMKSRKLFFCRQAIQNLQIHITTLKIAHYFEILDSIDLFLQLLSNIPDDMILVINQNFYDSSHKSFLVPAKSIVNISLTTNQSENVYMTSDGIIYSKSDSISISDYENYLTRLSAYCTQLSNQISSEIKTPLWATNYPLYLRTCVNECLHCFDEDLSYLLPQNCEVSLSRVFFNKNSPYAAQIDTILRSINKIQPEAFQMEFLNLCTKLMPRQFYEETTRDDNLQNEYIIALTFLYRVLFDRIYELFERTSINSSQKPSTIPFITMFKDVNNQNLIQINIKNNQKYHELKKLKMSAFNWPITYLPQTPTKNNSNEHNEINSIIENEATNQNIHNEDNQENIQNQTNQNESHQNIQNERDATIQSNSDIQSQSNIQNQQTYESEQTIPNEQNNETIQNQQTYENNENEQNNENIQNDKLPDSILEMMIQNFFRDDDFYLPAIQFLELSIFYTNPIDILYYVHKFLACTQKAANIHSAMNSNQLIIDKSQLNRLICFDDLFLLSLAGIISADLPDLYSMSWFVQTFAPDGLSSAIDFAKSNLEGLTEHISTSQTNQL